MHIGKVILSTSSESETFNVGAALGSLLTKNTVIGVNGELGVGKTVLIKGAAKALGIEHPIRSPTFTLLQVYQGFIPLYHFDFYRLEEEEELMEIGFYEFVESEGVVFIEWAQKFSACLPEEFLEIYLERYNIDNLQASNNRKIYLFPRGNYYEKMVEKLLEINRYDYQGRLTFNNLFAKNE